METTLDAHITTVTTTAASNLIEKAAEAFRRAMLKDGKVTPELLAIQGMSGAKYRYFINNLIGSLSTPHYLEVGVWAGSTLCSAIFGNEVTAMAIDNWSEFGGPSDKFFTNLSMFKGKGAKVSFLERDFRSVDYKTLPLHDVYLFDGPHSEVDQFDGLALALPALKDEFVLVVDDWNWPPVRQGTSRAIKLLGLKILWSAEVRTTLDDKAAYGGDWHNGYFIGVIQRPQRSATAEPVAEKEMEKVGQISS